MAHANTDKVEPVAAQSARVPSRVSCPGWRTAAIVVDVSRLGFVWGVAAPAIAEVEKDSKEIVPSNTPDNDFANR